MQRDKGGSSEEISEDLHSTSRSSASLGSEEEYLGEVEQDGFSIVELLRVLRSRRLEDQDNSGEVLSCVTLL